MQAYWWVLETREIMDCKPAYWENNSRTVAQRQRAENLGKQMRKNFICDLIDSMDEMDGMAEENRMPGDTILCDMTLPHPPSLSPKRLSIIHTPTH